MNRPLKGSAPRVKVAIRLPPALIERVWAVSPQSFTTFVESAIESYLDMIDRTVNKVIE